MQTVNIHEAKMHLSRLVDEAAKGNVFILAKVRKPMVKVLPLSDGAVTGTEWYKFNFLFKKLLTELYYEIIDVPYFSVDNLHKILITSMQIDKEDLRYAWIYP